MPPNEVSTRREHSRSLAHRGALPPGTNNVSGRHPGRLKPSWTAPEVAPFEKSLRQQTADVLRQSILNFQLKPGQRLVEREFIERLGVSRATFREAIRELAAEGLVTVVSQKGARVSAPTAEEAADLYEVRSALECLAVTWFVERAEDKEVRSLTAAVKHFKRVAGMTTDTLELLRAKELFYDVLIRGARSNALQQLLEGINSRVHALRATSLSRPGRVRQTSGELEAIVDAVSERNAALASRLCEQHIRNACQIALAHLQGEDGITE